MTQREITHAELFPRHAFGTRDSLEPAALVRPRQVHGKRVAVLREAPAAPLGDADAVVSAVPQLLIGVVTADCVPILVARGGCVAAIHAGWRGLAAGVIEEALAALDRLAGAEVSQKDAAVIGPFICAHHYEIDEPVRDALRPRYGTALDAALTPTRPEHWQLDLGCLAREALVHGGWPRARVFLLPESCTFADSERFASRRRDGARGERLVHWIETPVDSTIGTASDLDTENPSA